MIKKCELLAPAGGIKQFIAAVENGADAVYIGGVDFNARKGAENFSDADIVKAVKYAHLRNVKVYVTMNTLMKGDELEGAVKYALFLYEIGIDALIIQDLGFGKLIKQNLPDFPIHLSTQATVYDYQGVVAAKRLGYERVVLAREVSFDEIKKIIDKQREDKLKKNETMTEIEIFVHGALCMCYSGQCQLSRVIGGRSGNRGECAQPCRLPFINDKNKKHYYLSPKDLCLIKHIGEIIESGVASLKIEGRMKSPEYVAVVTGIYRKYIDMYYEKGRCEVSDSDWKELLQIYNRGGFTEGYFKGKNEHNFIVEDVPGHRGIYVGKVNAVKDNSALIGIVCAEQINMGDVLEIRSTKTVCNTVSYLKKIADNQYRVGDFRGKIKKGDLVYKVRDAEQIKGAKTTFENVDISGMHSKRKSSIKGKIILKIGKNPLIEIEDIETGTKVKYASRKTICEKADNVGLKKDDVIDKLNRTGETPFEFAEINVDVEDGLFVPLSEINKIRREALNELIRLKIAYYNRGKREVNLKDQTSDLKFIKNEDVHGKFKKLPHITKNLSGAELKEILNDMKGNGNDTVIVNNIGQIKNAKEAGLCVIGGPGLNIYNKMALHSYMDLGVSGGMYSFEHFDAANGAIKVMQINRNLDTKYLIDRKSKKFYVRYDEKTNISTIYNRAEP